MLGLVFVSHSYKLAQALRDLAQQVSPAQVPIACAGGVGENRAEFGTDATAIAEAIQQVDHPNGVLVLMDLGSAILSAQMALELLPEALRARVHFCPAPLVEGAIAAAVQASLSDDIEAVCREAQGSLKPKAEQLGFEDAAAETQAGSPAAEARQRIFTLVNPHGLHARPAAQFVQRAARFQAEIYVHNLTTGKGPVSARSLNALATLGALEGHRIAVSASGPQAEQALTALAALVEDGFGERAEETPQTAASQRSAPPEEGAYAGIPIADGIALGKLHVYRPAPPLVPSRPGKDPQTEWAALQTALQQAGEYIRKRRRRVAQTAGETQAAIFDAHALLLQDPALLERAHRSIQNGQNAAAAWQAAVEQAASEYDALPDEYLRQRAADVRDVGRQVLLLLTGGRTHTPTFSSPVILLAEDLTPTETAQLDLKNVLGIATVRGGPTSHSAILARGLGIPAVAGLPPQVLTLPDATDAALDGFSGYFWAQPDEQVRARLEARRSEWLTRQETLLQKVHQPAATTDNRRVEVAANAGSLEEAHAACRQGADGIGLLRTEFLFLTRTAPPSEEEQMNTLQAISAAMDNLPVIVRTLDAGGDKPLPYIQHPQEANPFLGTRAIRLGFRQEDLFRTQLRAILRAGAQANLRVMFPMVATLDELRRARALLESVHTELESAGLPHRWPIETGIMVEIPSAALCAAQLAPEVDFFSIGTNDLTQYTLAAERGNPNLEYLSDGLHPAVLRLIRMVTEAAHAAGKWVGVCGELAGDLNAAPILVGLGVDELSLNPAGIPQVKERICQLEYRAAQRLAEKALEAPDARAVRRLVEQAAR